MVDFSISFGAGILGALLGIGGGVILVPALTLLLGVDIRCAAGASIISVIATSIGSSASHLRGGFANIRLGMFLEVATVGGAATGAFAAGAIDSAWLYIIFGMVLFYVSYMMFRGSSQDGGNNELSNGIARRLGLSDGYYDDAHRAEVRYGVKNTPLGFGLSYIAGVLSGLLGIGGGFMKVPVMHVAMGLPFKAASTTSNFMIGVTAAAAAGAYFARGEVVPFIAAPVALGAMLGSILGARWLAGISGRRLVFLFAILLAWTGIRMFWKGAAGV